MDYKILWTHQAIHDLEEILDYLEIQWSQKEIEKFKNKLSKQLELIQRFPKMFPISGHNPKLRKAVLSKQTTLFYQIENQIIFLVYLFVNYQDINRIK
ncbi:MAG: type II toxin-antitoxin system RelE/ParE family toxin [Prolixibacteraceae bacterium]